MENQNYPLVTIITVVYGQIEVTAEMLESLFQISYPNFEIIVVDNASPNCNIRSLKEKFPAIYLIENQQNLGFAGANNIAIQKALGKYVLLLNNDTIVDQSFLEPLVKKLESNSHIGAVSPKIRFFSAPDTIQYVGMTQMNPYSISNNSIGYCTKDIGQYEHDQKTYFAHGAAMMVRLSVIKEIGLMTDIYFLYYEELDWGLRIRNAGYEIHYVHDSLIYHKESITTGVLSPLKIYFLNRSRLLYMRRNIHGLTFVISLLYLIFISIPKNIFSRLVKGEFKLLNAYLKAIIWHCENLFNTEIHAIVKYNL